MSPSAKPQLNVRPGADVPGLVNELGRRYSMSQSEVVTWAVRRLARSEGLLGSVNGSEASEATDHLNRASKELDEAAASVEEARAGIESALDRLDPLPVQE